MHAINVISEAHGWYMAGLGILVVFLSLIILSIIISQIQKAFALWDARTRKKSLHKITQSPESNTNTEYTEPWADHPRIMVEDALESSNKMAPLPHAGSQLLTIHETAAMWAPLIGRLDSTFHLADLYKLAGEHDLPHPHLTISRLRRENILAPVENHMFSFNFERKGP